MKRSMIHAYQTFNMIEAFIGWEGRRYKGGEIEAVTHGSDNGWSLVQKASEGMAESAGAMPYESCLSLGSEPQGQR